MSGAGERETSEACAPRICCLEVPGGAPAGTPGTGDAARHSEGNGTMIEIRQLVKQYGDKTAVDGLDFTVKPGVVTGFLGPNGAGKSTTMRMIIGLDAPTAGAVTVNGLAYARQPAPLTEVGALLEAKAVHTSRTAYNHLRALAATHGIGRRRVDEVLELVGITEVANKRAGGF